MPPRQLTFSPRSHVLTTAHVFSPDGNWIVFDTRSARGTVFDCAEISRVHVRTGEVRVLYRAPGDARCGVATYHPSQDQVAFILGPTRPTPDFDYGPSRRQGVVLDIPTGVTTNLDARDVAAPFTDGALRGGTHLHVFSADGRLVASTYEDDLLARLGPTGDHHLNQRTLAVSVVNRPVTVPKAHPRNHDGSAFTAVVVATTNDPAPGSDEISRACEEAWIGAKGYLRADGTRQRHALAFQGTVITPDGKPIREVFVVDLPDPLVTQSPPLPGAGLRHDVPLQGTPTRRPGVLPHCAQRRLTFTAHRKHPGLAAPRHWLRTAPDGGLIVFVMADENDIPQLHTLSPLGGDPHQVTHNLTPVASSFTWSPDGKRIAYVTDNRVCVCDVATGLTTPLTPPAPDAEAPRPEACVFSPDGTMIAYVRLTRATATGARFDQIWLATLKH